MSNSNMEDDIRGLTLNQIIRESEIGRILISLKSSSRQIDEDAIGREILIEWLNGHDIKRIAKETRLPMNVIKEILKRMQKVIVREYGNLT